MKIQFMNGVLENPNLKRWANEGLPIEKIKELEAIYNQGESFPSAIREFLFIAGEFNNLGFDIYPNMFGLQENARKNLDYCSYSIERPFLAFDNVTDYSSFSFVYLDEDQQDPRVYICQPYRVKHGYRLIHPYLEYTFTSLVNEHIYRLQRGYSLD